MQIDNNKIVAALREVMDPVKGQDLISSRRVTDLKIDGDKAVGKAGDESINFIREDGRWHLTAAIME